MGEGIVGTRRALSASGARIVDGAIIKQLPTIMNNFLFSYLPCPPATWESVSGDGRGLCRDKARLVRQRRGSRG